MQQYNKTQKFLSFSLIFSIFFSFTFNVSFFSFLGTIFAQDNKNYNLVSLIVQEEIYDDVKTSVNKYAENIQNTIPNTKTIIIPTPSSTNPYNIASLNEKLYFEGYNGLASLKGNSSLIGTIFIGDLALPVVENNGSFEKTVFPYVDFYDKLYIYDNNFKRYKLNSSPINPPSAEIWHSFISPNTGDSEEDVVKINEFFEKTNDFYSGEGNFKTSSGITNGNKNDSLIDEYKPYVIYYDQLRESSSIKFVDYTAYESYLENIEDISYNRFSNKLSKTLQEKYSSAQEGVIGDTSLLFEEGSGSAIEGSTISDIPDIQTKEIVQKTTKKFLEIFNASSLGDFRKDVHNAGRYNLGGEDVGVDIIPYLLTVVDTYSHSILKNASNDLEENIDNLVKNGLSRNIAIPTTFIASSNNNDDNIYTNFLYGKQASSIGNASECTFYRGSTYNSGQLVQANRAFNINNIKSDTNLCNLGKTIGYWGENSPINLDFSDSQDGEIWKLKTSNTKLAIVPIYDILGSLKTTNVLKNPNPKNCFDNNLLITTQYIQDEIFGNSLSYQVPIDGKSAAGWNCGTTNQSFPYNYDFDYVYKNFISGEIILSCENYKTLNLDGVKLKSACNDNIINNSNIETFNFHKISSWIEHKSPTDDELSKQLEYMISPNLPIDKDRYIDFISADNTYTKINYPYLYRIIFNSGEDFSFENAKKALKKYLDEKSSELNEIITSTNPSKLSGDNAVIYSLLKTGNYPEANIDLYKYIENKPDKEVEIFGDKKTMSYIDSLIFSIYWNNLNSVSAKYKFIFENYLSDQFGGNDYNFYLPKNKKQYEIAYLGAPGDAKNMYIKINPDEKGENPYNDIISKNLDLNNYSLNIGSGGSGNNSNNFKCAPPEGVPIWKWIDSVKCRLQDILPPTISLSSGSCGMSLMSSGDSTNNNYDENKNGVIDYLENEIKNGKLSLKADSIKYYYNKTGILKAQILNSSGSVISFDNNSKINFELLKVIVPKDEKQTFNEVNSKIIYDKTSSNVSLNDEISLKETGKYVSFKDISSQVTGGQTQYNFTTKSKDANLVFKATLNLKDNEGNIIISKNEIVNIQIRGELFYGSTYKIEKEADEVKIYPGFNSTIASNSKNLYFIEEENFNLLKTNLNSLNSLSNSKDKLFISLAKVDKNNNYLDIKYPLVVKITDTFGKNILEPFSVNNLNSPISLGISKAGIYNIEIKDITGYIIKKEIEIMPDIGVKILPNLSTNLVEKDGVITTNVFSIYDQFENPTIGTNYEVDVSISGNSMTFEDNSKTQKFSVLDGYKLFRLKSTSNIGISNIKFTLKLDEKKIDEKTLPVNVVEKMNFDLVGFPENIKVGNNSYEYKLEVKKETENSKINPRAYLISNNIYIIPEKEYIDFENGLGVGRFSTTLKAGEKIKLEFKIEGVKNSIYKEIDILPDLPIKINLNLSKSKIESSSLSSANIYAEIKDRYDNIIWNDDSTSLNIEVLDKYKHIIKPTKNSEIVKKGKTNFIINGTENPGTAYFKISSNPDLSKNKIEIGENENKIVISGVGENAGKIESFYFWNKDKIIGKKYNSIYTTLLGSNYGDITIKDNLANSIIFDKNNRALGVTTLLNDSTKYQEILNINQNGNLKLNTSSTDISQDISSFFNIVNGSLELSFFNNTFSNYIGKIYYNIDKSNLEIKNCSSLDISSCYTKEKDTLILKSQNSNYLVENISGDLVFKDKNNNILFTIFSNGNISKDIGVNFEIAENYTNGGVFNLKVGNQIIGIFGINLIGNNVKIIRDINLLESVKNSLKAGGVIVYLEGRDYFFKEAYLGTSTKENFGYIISYNDPFASSKKSINNFGNSFEFGYEQFFSKDGIGWKEDNKILLSFSAGKSIGEATKDFMTFSSINIGDPVASLKSIPKKLSQTDKTRKYDGTIGTLISKDENNIGYNTLDYNNDKNQDIIILKRDGYIKLLEGTGIFGNFTDKGNIVYFTDLSKKTPIISGDFFGDEYEDIVLLDKDRKIIFVSNNEKDFRRINTNIKFDGMVNQVIGFDMDKDGKKDLVILDDMGDLYIFYGTDKEGIFVKLKVDSSLGLTLNESIRQDGGAIYYDGLYQLPIDKIAQNILDSEALLNEEDKGFNESIVDNLIFTKMNYSSTGGEQLANELTTFLRTEYAGNEGLEVAKKYTDLNGKTIRGGDIVKLNVKIKNNTINTINNLAYVEKIQDTFFISSSSPYNLKIDNKEILPKDIIIQTSPSDEYTILLNSYKNGTNISSISLLPGETLELEIMLQTRTFEYGFIDAGFFDETTEQGDILFKTKNENCGQPSDIYKSVATRQYQKDIKQAVCENELPDELKDNAIDTDGNGVPDYIDKLSNSTSSELAEYAKDKLGLFNKSSNTNDLGNNFLNSLDSIDADVDKIVSGIDTILAGLSCGFGGGSCISTPLNWAPLAPGNDPTLFGMPIGDGLRVNEGLPIFAFPTSCLIPVWPPCPKGAGGRFGGGVSQIRLFITPTLTGSMGTAICFGPNYVAGMLPPPGLSPFIPGGNCIVAAAPAFGCKNDGSDGEIYNIGEGVGGGNIINGNCNNEGKAPSIYLGQTARDYMNYKKTGIKTNTLNKDIKDIFSSVAKGKNPKWEIPNQPLLTMQNGEASDVELDVDFGALKGGSFEDVTKINMKRISPFPDFIMDWVTRQVEEFINKLTDFPTLYIILPDFSGVYDSSWGGFMDKLKNSYEAGEQKSKQNQAKIQSKMDSLENSGKNIDCEKDQIGCLTNSLEKNKLYLEKNVSSNTTAGGIKSAYEFISNLPIINIETQRVDLNIPWPGDKKTITKAILDFEITKKQWEEEFERAKAEWNIEKYNCVGTSDSIECKNIIQVQNLINSIDKNIAILESYSKIPENIYKLVKIKDTRIEQILCNIEAISKITGGWIGDNGKRFKAWVQLYVLIKAILKSWQLLVDVFIDYDAACHECKNERSDLLYFEWKLISMVLPKIPIFQIPKWPDIYIDLHNIKVSLNILIPEFEFNLRPILLPTLPKLYLPNSPSINLLLPTLPLLQSFELLTLPELPTLPSINLPNLPPPPKLPKLLSSIEGVLKVLKIITKVMCILKSSPFVPEWRAGDQIAYITERTGYLSMDFLDISLPQFSYPYIDAIKITSFVNLEVDSEFLVEIARQSALPLNTFTNDVVHMLDIGIGDLDFRGLTPEDINIKIPLNKTSFLKKDDKISMFDFAVLISLNLLNLHKNIETISKIDLTNDEFKKEIAKNISKIDNEKIIGVWQNALNYSFKKEDTLIKDLIQNNENKFNEVKSILQEEKQKNDIVLGEVKEIFEKKKENNILISSIKSSDASSYNTRLEIYNQKAINSIGNLFKEDSEVSKIRSESKELLENTKTSLLPNNNLLATNIGIPTPITVQPPTVNVENNQGTCNLNNNGYGYKYEGIYVVEQFITKKISYLLFDYLDELSGKEVIKESDFDGDGDQDIIYMVGNEVYLKQNFNNQELSKEYYSGAPIILESSDNPYLTNNFIQGVNGFTESISDNSYINIGFKDSKNVNNYRIEFFQIVDKFQDKTVGYLDSYTPKNIKKYIVDVFSDIENITIDNEGKLDYYTTRKNLAYINSIGSLAGVNLYTKKLINLLDDISSNKEITINSGTKIYSASSTVKLSYYLYKEKENEIKFKEVILNPFSNIEFKEDIVVIGTNGKEAFVSGDSYINLSGNQIANYIKKPLLEGAIITYDENEKTIGTSPFINIKYYDNNEINLDLKETKYYQLYDLGLKADDYLVRTKLENDFYYAKIKSFKNNIFSTYSNQILLSPQKESDTQSPQISNFYNIKIPVYQKNTLDVSDFIFEDSGNKNIKDIYIDFDLEKDSSGDGNLINDKDFSLPETEKIFSIKINGNKIFFDIGPFDKLVNKTIRLYIVDSNDNIGYKDLNFVVYSPDPKIENIKDSNVYGKINESLIKEPVSFYRFRNNSLTRLEDYNKNKTTNTFTGGEFKFDVKDNSFSGVIFTHSGETIFNVSEETGKINIPSLNKIKYKINLEVLASNDLKNEVVYPKIIVKKEDIPVYYEYLSVPNIGKVETVNDFLEEVINGNFSSKIGVYYKHNLSNYDYVNIPLGLNNNSGDTIVFEKNKNTVFEIFKDGRINIKDENYYLEYSSFGDYIVYKLKRIGSEDTIGEVMIIPEKNYIIK